MKATVGEIIAAHRDGSVKPEETARECLRRIREHGDPAVFISLADEEALVAQAREAAKSPSHPLCGVPLAVKDNIDALGFPTTAACPAYSYTPSKDATAVARLRAAGAVIVGKTNLDQFATGLVGVRSPYGVPRNPFDPAMIPGGSSSGSAVAVSAGLVPLALGTDTAGSGRVPAGLNNIVGLKPSLGLISTSGVVPACRSLDCVSIFALTADDAWAALGAVAGFDDADSYSRQFQLGVPGAIVPPTIGVPRAEDRLFFGDKRSELAFGESIELAKSIGAKILELDFSHLLEAARLLYEGPWVAERTAAVGAFVEAHPDEIFPVTRQIIAAGEKLRTVDAFHAFYRMQDLRALARKTMAQVDVLMVPTVPAVYTLEDLAADPGRLNSNLGTYTNFVNLMDLCGLAVPAVFAKDGTPYGVTFLANTGEDAKLLSLGRALHEKSALPLGALKISQPAPNAAPVLGSGEVEIAVVGAHMAGLALNHELVSLGARFLRVVKTAPDYQLFLLDGTKPFRPGMLRVEAGKGAEIEAEIWSMSAEAFGKFVSKIPSPLTIGNASFADKTVTKCFLVEAAAVHRAEDISRYGGWRGYAAATGKL
ncbi:MAG: allophanate hydrolase [Xanthobacteraceae bacterium]|nr:allophanate hydrolase [Xanthobacteraceae bacterium]